MLFTRSANEYKGTADADRINFNEEAALWRSDHLLLQTPSFL